MFWALLMMMTTTTLSSEKSPLPFHRKRAIENGTFPPNFKRTKVDAIRDFPRNVGALAHQDSGTCDGGGMIAENATESSKVIGTSNLRVTPSVKLARNGTKSCSFKASVSHSEVPLKNAETGSPRSSGMGELGLLAKTNSLPKKILTTGSSKAFSKAVKTVEVRCSTTLAERTIKNLASELKFETAKAMVSHSEVPSKKVEMGPTGAFVKVRSEKLWENKRTFKEIDTLGTSGTLSEPDLPPRKYPPPNIQEGVPVVWKFPHGCGRENVDSSATCEIFPSGIFGVEQWPMRKIKTNNDQIGGGCWNVGNRFERDLEGKIIIDIDDDFNAETGKDNEVKRDDFFEELTSLECKLNKEYDLDDFFEELTSPECKLKKENDLDTISILSSSESSHRNSLQTISCHQVVCNEHVEVKSQVQRMGNDSGTYITYELADGETGAMAHSVVILSDDDSASSFGSFITAMQPGEQIFDCALNEAACGWIKQKYELMGSGFSKYYMLKQDKTKASEQNLTEEESKLLNVETGLLENGSLEDDGEMQLGEKVSDYVLSEAACGWIDQKYELMGNGVSKYYMLKEENLTEEESKLFYVGTGILENGSLVDDGEMQLGEKVSDCALNDAACRWIDQKYELMGNCVSKYYMLKQENLIGEESKLLNVGAGILENGSLVDDDEMQLGEEVSDCALKQAACEWIDQTYELMGSGGSKYYMLKEENLTEEESKLLNVETGIQESGSLVDDGEMQLGEKLSDCALNEAACGCIDQKYEPMGSCVSKYYMLKHDKTNASRRNLTNEESNLSVEAGMLDIGSSMDDSGMQNDTVLAKDSNNSGSFTTPDMPGRLRKRKQSHCHTLVEDISFGKEKIPIRVVNEIDNEKAPIFNYITNMVYPQSDESFMVGGCHCIDGCSDSVQCYCVVKNGGMVPFNDDGALVRVKPIVHECGPSCRCPPSCKNRVSQHGLKFQLEVFKTESRGWGVRSRNKISSGSFICEYVGELLNDKQAEERAGFDEYLFDIGICHDRAQANQNLKEPSSGYDDGFSIDAAHFGNIGRFVNHSCSPNLYAQDVLFDHEDKKMPHVMLFVTKNIPPLQELTYDYNYKIDQVRDANGNIKTKACCCGARKCTRRMY